DAVAGQAVVGDGDVGVGGGVEAGGGDEAGVVEGREQRAGAGAVEDDEAHLVVGVVGIEDHGDGGGGVRLGDGLVGGGVGGLAEDDVVGGGGAVVGDVAGAAGVALGVGERAAVHVAAEAEVAVVVVDGGGLIAAAAEAEVALERGEVDLGPGLRVVVAGGVLA